MKSIYSLTFRNLEDFLIENGLKKFVATQIYEWIYKKRVKSYGCVRNVKSSTLELLAENYQFNNLEIVNVIDGVDVVKFLFELTDGDHVEAVLMKHDYGNSLCISTQVGCNMGCAFCESGRLKKARNLSTDEMVLQVLEVEERLGIRISHVVLMGIGEPFDNYDNVIDFIDIINSGKGIDIGARHITISTCGIVPKIKEFMNLDKQVNLAISLHAPNNELRNELMPINKAYDINLLIQTLKEYINKTNRRVTFEYILLRDINDTKECARELAELIKGMNAYVNLIPYNETSHFEFRRSTESNIKEFYNILKHYKINVTVRREFGSNLKAACGQLRAETEGR